MNGVLKWVLGLAALFLGLIVLAIALLGIFFDPNDYKSQIQDLARKHAELDLKIEGDIGWSVFPWLGLEVSGVKADKLDGSPLASLSEAQISIRLPALFAGQVEMSGITIAGLDMTLVRDEQGRGNWELGTAAGQAPAESKPPADSSGAAAPLGLNIASISLKDAHIVYDDRQQGMKVEVKDLNLQSNNVVTGQAFPVEASFQLTQSQKQQSLLQLQAQLSTQALLNLDAQRYAAKDLDVKLQLQGQPFAGKTVDLNLKGTTEVDLKQMLAQISGLQLTLANLKMSGDLKAEQFDQAPKVSGQLQVAPFDAKALLQALGQPAIVTAEAKALTQVAFSTKLTGPTNTLGLSDLKLQLDSTQFTGNASYALDSGRIGADLQGTSINLDGYLPPAADKPAKAPSEKTEKSAGTASGQGYSKEPVLPVEVLRGLNLQAKFALAEVISSGLKMNNLQLQAKANGGLIEVSKISGDLYQGSFSNSATIDARRVPVQVSLKKQVKGIQLGSLLKDLTQEVPFTGRFDMQGDYQVRGNSVHDFVNSLDGQMKLNLADGRIQGVNLVDKLCRGLLQLRGGQPTDTQVADYTEFSNLNGSIKFVKGVADNRDLKAAMAGVNLGGEGQVDLPQKSLNYGLSLTVLQELRGPNCQIEEKLHNLSFPLRCSGGFDTPPTKLCRPDTDAMKKTIADLGKREVKEKLEKKIDQKIEQKLGDKLQGEGADKVKDALKGLFR